MNLGVQRFSARICNAINKDQIGTYLLEQCSTDSELIMLITVFIFTHEANVAKFALSELATVPS